jgi:hypothetical protein
MIIRHTLRHRRRTVAPRRSRGRSCQTDRTIPAPPSTAPPTLHRRRCAAIQQQQEARSKTPVWLIAVLRLCLSYSHSCSCVFYFKNWICCGMRGSPGHRVGGRANPSRRGAHRRRCRIPLFARHIHLGGSLVSRMLVMLATPMIDLSFDRLQQRCFTLEMRDADLRSPME